MECKDSELLKEFEDLISTVGKEVSMEISAKISSETIEYVIQSMVMEKLQELINNADSLNKKMPKTELEIQHVFENINKSSKQIDEQLSAISVVNNNAIELLKKTHIVSDDFKNIVKEFIQKTDIEKKEYDLELKNQLVSMGEKIDAIEKRIQKQENIIEKINSLLCNRGVN